MQKGHSEREHHGTAGSQAWDPDWKAERSQREEGIKSKVTSDGFDKKIARSQRQNGLMSMTAEITDKSVRGGKKTYQHIPPASLTSF